jgi:NADH-quinone oxidoreductase subunit C
MSDGTGTTDAAAGQAETEPEAPTDEARQAVLDQVATALGDAVLDSHIAVGRGLWVRVARDAWFEAAGHVRNGLGFHFFDYLSAIDWMPSPWGRYEYSAVDDGIKQFDPDAAVETGVAGGDTRFQVMCRLIDVRRRLPHLNVVLKADLPDDDLSIASLVPLFPGANWHERECWEMFGIRFEGHPGLRHLYLPGEFEGHPLRKDFPLLARLVKPWPGIVDVEPMPGEPAGDGGGEGESDATEGGTEGTES